MKAILHDVVRRVLPATIKKRIVSWGLKLDRDTFRELAYRKPLAPDMELGLRHLASRGLQPRRIVDIGAFEGEWTRMARDLWPDAQISMVEANPSKEPILKKTAEACDATLHMSVLGPQEGAEVVFYIMESGSSVLPENSALERRAETFKTTRLDTLLEGAFPDFIKMDVQGFEIEVLKGASAILAQAQGLLVEVSLIPTNQGAPFMSDVVAFMKAQGYEVCDVLELHRRPLDRAINQVDLLFVPAASPLLADKRHY